MLDSKTIFRSKCQNYKIFNKIMINIAAGMSNPVLQRSQVSNPIPGSEGMSFSLAVTGRDGDLQ